MRSLLCGLFLFACVGCGGNKGSGPPKASTETDDTVKQTEKAETKTKAGSKVSNAPINSLSG